MKAFFNIILFIGLVIGVCNASSWRPPKHVVTKDRSKNLKEDEYPHFPRIFGALHTNASANYDYLSSSFTVPPLPSNLTAKVLDFSIAVKTLSLFQNENKYMALGLYHKENESRWSMETCTCPISEEECNCTSSIIVNPGEVIHFVFSHKNGSYSISGTSSSGLIAIHSEKETKFNATFGSVQFQWSHQGVENCNNLPSSNSLLISDLVLKDGGKEVHNINWATFGDSSFCSLQVAANDIAVLVKWNSNNWTGKRETCAIGWFQAKNNSWIENGKRYTQFDVKMISVAYDDAANITKYAFTLNPVPSQIWRVSGNNGSYSIPSFALPLVPMREIFTFGYISTGMATIEGRECEGGERQLVGDEDGHAVSGSFLESPLQNNEGCMVNFTQRVESQWNDGLGNMTQVNVIIINSGKRLINSLNFTSNKTSSIFISWPIEHKGGIFTLPSYSPSLSTGSSFSFNYIVKSDGPIDFHSTNISCN